MAESPSGADDLASQVEELERQKQQLLRAAHTEPTRVIDSDGNDDVPAHSSGWELDDDGNPVLDEFGKPVPKWRHEFLHFDGVHLEVRKPKPQALQAFSLAVSTHTKAKTKNDMIGLFVKNHLSDASFAFLLSQMMDPDSDFTVARFGDLMREIATLGTARPTQPSLP